MKNSLIVRKAGALLLAGMIITSAMVGCKQSTPENQATPDTSTKAAGLPKTVNYPIVTDGSITLDYWMPIANAAIKHIDSYAKNTAYQEVQKKTGIKINFIHPAVGKAKEQFNLLIASGDLPDLIQFGSYYNGDVYKGFEDGAYMDLTPYINQYAPDYLKVINSNDIVKRMAYKSGKVIAFYSVNLSKAVPYYRPVLRADWLKEFGMKTPKTLEEYEAYFKAILDKKPGVTPFTTRPSVSVGDNEVWMGAFDMLAGWFLVNNKVTHYLDNPNYKDYLTLMNKWYNLGYLSKDFAALGEDAKIYALFDSGRLGLYTQSVDNAYSRAEKIGGGFEVESGPYPRKAADSKLHTGVANFPINKGTPYDTVITNSCKYVKEAVQFLNFAFTEEGSRVYNYGVEGLAYNMVNGKPTYTDFMLNNPNGLTLSEVPYIHKVHLGTKLGAPDNEAAPSLVKDPKALAFRMKWSDDPNVDDTYRLPPFDLTADELAQVNDIMSDVSPYASEMMLKFIIGAEPLSNFDAYLAKLKQLNFPKAKEIQQAAYDRYLKN